ncbi:MAG: biopolymer transporter ExbD [Woeseiaceae bacterium]
MTRSKLRESEQDSEVNLTPMLDVVFILLIFFVVTASFINEKGIDVNKPEAPNKSFVDNPTILIAITENNEIWIDRRLIDPRAVRANIERLHMEFPKGMVVIQADDKSHNKILVQVMDAARQAGVFNITMAANPE